MEMLLTWHSIRNLWCISDIKCKIYLCKSPTNTLRRAPSLCCCSEYISVYRTNTCILCMAWFLYSRTFLKLKGYMWYWKKAGKPHCEANSTIQMFCTVHTEAYMMMHHSRRDTQCFSKQPDIVGVNPDTREVLNKLYPCRLLDPSEVTDTTNIIGPSSVVAPASWLTSSIGLWWTSGRIKQHLGHIHILPQSFPTLIFMTWTS